jgi:hypothetical protein
MFWSTIAGNEQDRPSQPCARHVDLNRAYKTILNQDPRDHIQLGDTLSKSDTGPKAEESR